MFPQYKCILCSLIISSWLLELSTLYEGSISAVVWLYCPGDTKKKPVHVQGGWNFKKNIYFSNAIESKNAETEI